MKRIIVVAILTSLLNLLPRASFVSNDLSWDLYYLCTRIEIAAWLAVATSFIPYRHLATKSLAGIFVIQEFFDALAFGLVLAIGREFSWLYWIKVLAVIDWTCFICWRDYDRSNDELDEDHFFKVGIIPTGFQDFLLSLMSDPLGGTGIYAQGCFYHYRKGRMAIHNKEYIKRASSKYRIIRMGPIDEMKLRYLKSMQHSGYSKWSWVYNCKTVLEPILSKRGSPYFKPRRSNEKKGRMH